MPAEETDLEPAAFGEVHGVTTVDLPGSGHPGPEVEPTRLPERVGRDVEAGRPRTDQAHLAAQHVDELRELVQARAAEEAPEPGDPRVVRHPEVRPGHLAKRSAKVLENLRP